MTPETLQKLLADAYQRGRESLRTEATDALEPLHAAAVKARTRAKRIPRRDPRREVLREDVHDAVAEVPGWWRLGRTFAGTVGELVREEERDLLRRKNVSVKTVAEIRRDLESRGLLLGMTEGAVDQWVNREERA